MLLTGVGWQTILCFVTFGFAWYRLQQVPFKLWV